MGRVRSPDGSVWIVRRRLLPWRPRRRRQVPHAFGRQLAAAGELVALALASLVWAPVTVAGRILLRRLWTVEAFRRRAGVAGGQVQVWRVVGWRPGRELIEEIKDEIRHQSKLLPQHAEQSGPVARSPGAE